MELGVLTFVTDDGMGARLVVELPTEPSDQTLRLLDEMQAEFGYPAS